MTEKIFHSIYTKFVVFFVGAFITSILASVIYITLTQIDDIKHYVNKAMTEKAENIKILVEEQDIPVERAREYLDTYDMDISVYNKSDNLINTLTKDEMTKLENGDIISLSRPHIDYNELVVFKLDNQYIYITLDISNSLVNKFRLIQRSTFIVPMMIGVILIIFAVGFVVKPIKKISDASKEVAKGNFNVRIKVRGNDEISHMSKNFNLMVEQLSLNEYLHKDFVSNVSHEFKTPITSLMGYAKLLRKKSTTEVEKQNYIGIIISESERLSNLSSNLLMLSKLENGVIRYKNDRFSLTEQIRDVILLMQNQWEKKNIELDLELEEVDFTGNKDLMYQVWINLIQNAIKYTKESGVLKIILKKTDVISVEVIDNGIGMTKEEQDKIFLRFYKADKSRNTTGTGLGLPITKKIIEIHGGTISVDSSIGEGSKFKVILSETGL
ncbi:two-component sensor histidine kinase [Vallitalea longa]|uniref:Heme sensor protein HssS n=1 Tax=Vallitalea longa TaxID=2936439 RepID=A0A9W5YCQ9_9FIRM|nr:HAMP domain-containing sensor histidine kinase [Vallitalea longa]GKX28828.1 two-component sensor histidine kinase [Vallitalea longa]